MTLPPPELINVLDYERAALAMLAESHRAYYAGGAADEITLRENRAVFDRITLRPRVLRDVSRRTLATTLLGHTTTMPIVIAPTAMARLGHPDGEAAIGRAAKSLGIIQCLSTFSTVPLEDVARAAGACWFQVYVYRDRGITERMVARAVAAGYGAIVVTVDLAVIGIRESERRAGLALPDGLTLGNIDGLPTSDARAVLRYIGEQVDPSLTWADLVWLRSISPLPVLVKGVLRGDDARRAVDAGAAGIVVSNHGGRQLDTSITALDALPEIVAAVGASTEVMMDGGIRRGTDILKAVALGARAVMVGRPVLWGLTVAGQKGVEHVLEILKHELDVALALAGCASLDDVGPDLLGR